MRNKKYLFLIIASLLLIFTLVVYFILQSRTQEPPNNQSFHVLDALPDSNSTYLPITEIIVRLDDDVDQNLFFYEVSPFVETYTRLQDESTIVIAPRTSWIPGTTTITIQTNTTSTTGKILGKPYLKQITTAFPETPNPDYEE